MQPKQQEVSLIIPNKDDFEALSFFLDEVLNVLSESDFKQFEIIIIDDGSKKTEKEKLKSLLKRSADIRIFFLAKNFGQQVALYYGLKAAKFDAVITIDGDGQYPASVIPKLASSIFEGYHLVSGVRTKRADNLFQVFFSWIGCNLIKVLMNTKMRDFGSCKGFSRPLVNKIVKFQFGAPDVYPAAIFWNPLLKEIDFEHRPRQIGHSRWTFTKRLKLFFDIYIKYGEDRFGLIFKIGLFLICGSLFGLALLTSYKLIFGHQSSFFLIFTLFGINASIGLQFILWNLFLSALRQQSRKEMFSQTNEDANLLLENVKSTKLK